MRVLLEAKTVELLNREAKRQGTDRSTLIRKAVRRYLSKLTRDADEREYIESYRRQPQRASEVRAWERIQSWPED